jgi:hypothetical protein
MPDPLTGAEGVRMGVTFMLAGWSLIVIWVVAKFSFM